MLASPRLPLRSAATLAGAVLLAAASLLTGCSAGPAVTGGVAGGVVATGSDHLLADGLASWYGPNFAGRPTANGEIFDPSQLTAAHKTLPFNTRVRVTNLRNGRSVTVRINDRGPFKRGRVIDLSRAAAERIGLIGTGIAPVRIELLDERLLRATTSASLGGYDVVSALHPAGQLLVLVGATDSVIVRVVPGTPPGGEADLIVSPEVYRILGPEVTVAATGS